IAAGEEELDGVKLELIDVRGHAHRQLAVRVDDVLLAADALFGAATLEKYPLPFAQDVGGQLTAIDAVRTTGARIALPGHGEPTEEIGALADANLAAVRRAAAAVEAACEGGGTEA